MATLKVPIKFKDFIMNRVTKKEVYMVLFEDLHNVWVIEANGKSPPKELPKRIINLAYTIVDEKTIEVLYADRNETIPDSNNSITTSK